MINQSRKRARSQIRSELAKEKEALEQQQQSETQPEDEDKQDTKEISMDLESTSDAPAFTKKEPETPKEKREMRPKIEARKNRRHSLSNMNKFKSSRKSPARLQRSPSDESLPARPTEGPPSLKRRSDTSPDVTGEGRQQEGGGETTGGESVPRPELTDLEEWTEHLRPTKVDTSNVEEEEILEVSSGLYHFALRTINGVYTWGKNLEKQLGNDSSRADVQVPTQLDTIKRPLSVQCGADFTLVVVSTGGGGRGATEALLAFGNNNMGQCGREQGDKSALLGKWVRLKISKRHIRIPDGSACVSSPTELQFVDGDEKEVEGGEDQQHGGMRYNVVAPPIKSLPQFKRKFFATSGYLKDLQRDSEGEKVDKGTEGEQMSGKLVGDLEVNMKAINLSKSKEGSEDLPTPDDDEEEEEDQEADKEELDRRKTEKQRRTGEGRKDAKEMLLKNGLPVTGNCSSEFIHYCLYLFYGIYDTDEVAGRCAFAEFRIRILMLQCKFFEAFQLALQEVAADDNSTQEEKMRQSIVLLEFFTKDENLIPMHEEDLKYFIQEIFVRFIERGWDLDALEQYFRRELSLYVVPLAYVLFFEEELSKAALDSTSSADLTMSGDEGAMGGASGAKQLRDSVLLKYRTFFNHLECAPRKYHVVGSSKIFDRVSVVFNAMICQRVVETFEEVQ